MKVAVVTTHPIQYQVPWIRLLAKVPGLEVVALFAMIPDASQQGSGFGVAFQWDLPLLEGYRHRVLKNISARPSVTERYGCDTPGVGDVLQEEKVDVVIVNGWVVKTCLQTLAACRRLGIPCLVRGESNLLRPRAWWKRILHRIHLRRYDAFLAIGKSNRAFYLAHGVPSTDIFDTPYCVDNDYFASRAEAAHPERDRIRQAWGIPSGAVVILFAGKFEAKKRPEDVIDVARKMVGGAQPKGRVHFLMVGSGERLERCRAAASGENLPVSFAGFLNQGEMSRAYAASDALILPSDHGETWGLVVNEAMACGLPAYVSDQVGCHPDLILPGETGRVFPLGDTSTLADLLESDLNEPGRLNRMGARAREHVQRFNFAAVVTGIRKALESVGSQ